MEDGELVYLDNKLWVLDLELLNWTVFTTQPPLKFKFRKSLWMTLLGNELVVFGDASTTSDGFTIGIVDKKIKKVNYFFRHDNIQAKSRWI